MDSVLAFETSSPVLSVAFKKGKSAITEKISRGFFRHSEKLLPAADGLLRKNKISSAKVGTFLIGRGPGSFTGLRVGFATLKGFLASKKRFCYGALSLDLIAEKIRLPDESRLAVGLDARREKIYARFYRRKGSRWQAEGEPEVLGVEEFCGRLRGGDFIAGDAIAKYGREIRRSAGARLLEERLWYPRASALISLWERRDAALVRLEKPSDFLPLYFRLAEAEEKKREHAHAR